MSVSGSFTTLARPLLAANLNIVFTAPQSGTVDIAVLPPVSVEGWTLLNLRERIEQIRTAYLETLTEWPTGEPGLDASLGRE